MVFPQGINPDRFDRLLHLAREEDLGTHGDLTTALLPETHQNAHGVWELRARVPGRFCGGSLLAPLLRSLAPEVAVEWWEADEAPDVEAGAALARLSGRAAQMLAAERTILNYVQRLSGVATLTHRYVVAVHGTHARIYDTRKTIPGWRDLDRYAVRCGGGHNHRHGLDDAVLIKDNHLAGVPLDRLAHTVFDMLKRLPALGGPPRFIEVEAASLAEARELMKVVGIDVILLDNFQIADVVRAVQLRDTGGLRGKVELEASGGITLANVGDYAAAGVERISIGAITHSAPALDLALDAVE